MTSVTQAVTKMLVRVFRLKPNSDVEAVLSSWAVGEY